MEMSKDAGLNVLEIIRSSGNHAMCKVAVPRLCNECVYKLFFATLRIIESTFEILEHFLIFIQPD